TNINNRELWWTYSGLNELAEAIEELKKNNGRILVLIPGVIWTRRIEKATDPHFWPNWRRTGFISLEGFEAQPVTASYLANHDLSAPFCGEAMQRPVREPLASVVTA